VCANPLLFGVQDLRRLTLKQSYAILSGQFGYNMTELKTLPRWEVVRLVRTKYTELAQITEVDNIFARGQKSTVFEHQERFKTECQEVFRQQNKSLSSTRDLTDEEDDDDDDDDDDDADGADNSLNLARLIKEKDMTRMQRDVLKKQDLVDEAKAGRELAKALANDFAPANSANGATGAPVAAAAATTTTAAAAAAAAGDAAVVGEKRLVITRQYIDENNKPFRRQETIRDPRVIKAYLQHMASRKGKHTINMQVRLPPIL
jgi:hypothetical protein